MKGRTITTIKREHILDKEIIFKKKKKKENRRVIKRDEISPN